jgi:hypothetical protein
MIKYDREQQEWLFQPIKVTLTNRNNQETKYTDDVEYYQEMSDKHDFITIDNVENFVPIAEQEERLADINSIETDQRFTGTYINYVKIGELPTDYIGKLKDIKIKKEQTSQDTDISELLYELMLQGVI